MDSLSFIFIVIIILVITFFIFAIYSYNNSKREILLIPYYNNNIPNNNIPNNNIPNNNINFDQNDINNITNYDQNKTIIYQPIMEENCVDPIICNDYRVLNDPLKNPTRRSPRYMYDDLESFNLSTRERKDTFSEQGYLIDEKASSNDPNKFLLLFGRQKWPKSSEYEYYIIFQNGRKELKYELEKYNRELFNKDEVIVDILNKRKYKVKLFKYQDFEYFV